MNDKNKVIDKIQKLLRLSENNPNIQEAAAAAARAQGLMDKYNIAKYMLESKEGVSDTEPIINFSINDPLEVFKSNEVTWKSALAYQIAKANSCGTYTQTIIKIDGTKSKFLCIVGTKNDVQIVKYLYRYLANEVERLCIRENNGYGKAWANSFKLGAITTIKQRLEEKKEEVIKDTSEEVRNKNPNAIVHLSNAIEKIKQKEETIEDFFKKAGFNNRNVNSKIVPDGFVSGQKAAKEIELEHNNKLNKPNKQIGE